MKYSSIAISVLCLLHMQPAAAHSYKQKINSIFYTPKKVGSFMCRVHIAGHTITTIGACGPVRQQ